jgi:hypothetical protein
MAIFTSRKQKKDIKVTFGKGVLYVEVDGSKPQALPLTWYPQLDGANDDTKQDWTVTAKGLHWSKLNIDIAVPGL